MHSAVQDCSRAATGTIFAVARPGFDRVREVTCDKAQTEKKPMSKTPGERGAALFVHSSKAALSALKFLKNGQKFFSSSVYGRHAGSGSVDSNQR
jgi:hypothetical protein